MVKEGAEVLRNTIKEAKSFPIEGVLNISDIWQNVLNFNENGIKNFSISLNDSSNYFNVALGEWSVVTGIPNSGTVSYTHLTLPTTPYV